MARGWTPTEDAIIRENAEMGPSWEGYAILLPGRSKTAIMSRRQKLGVAFDRGGARPATKRDKPRRKPQRNPQADAGTWTDEQSVTLVKCVLDMTRRTGHTTRECFFQLAKVVAAYRSEREER